MNDKIKIGEIIKSKRKQHGFTQKEFANLLNVSDKAVSNWEQGKNYPDIVLFDEIVKVLQIEMEVLLGIQRAKPEEVIKGISMITKEQKEEIKKERRVGIMIMIDLIMNFLIFGIGLLIIGKEPELVIPSAVSWLLTLALPMYYEFMYFFFMSQGKQPYLIRTVAILWCGIKVLIIVALAIMWMVGTGPDIVFKDVIDLFRDDYPSWEFVFSIFG